MKNRNGLIDIEKFIFSIIIVLYHAGTFYNDATTGLCVSGFIAVEFYFIVSGYLIAKKADCPHKNNILDENINVFYHRVKSIFPFILLACLTSNFFYFVENAQLGVLKHNLIFSTVDVLGLQMLGFQGFYATGVAWYLSVLFIISFILYPILCRKREWFTKYIAPITVVIILGYVCKIDGCLNNPGEWMGGLIYKGVLRGYADIAVGCIAYEVTSFIDKQIEKNCYKFKIIEIFGIITSFAYAIFHKNSDAYDFFLVPIMGIMVAISFSKHSIGKNLNNNKVCNWLGTFSLSIYLNHYYIKENLIRLYPYMNKNVKLMYYLILVAVISIFNFIIGNEIKKKPQQKIKYYSIIILIFIVACTTYYLKI